MQESKKKSALLPILHSLNLISNIIGLIIFIAPRCFLEWLLYILFDIQIKRIRKKKKDNRENYTIKTEEKSKGIYVTKKYHFKIFFARERNMGETIIFLSKLGQRLRPLNRTEVSLII